MIAIALATVVLSAVTPRVADVSYPYLAASADLICVGTVESVTSVGDEPREITLDSGAETFVEPFLAARLKVEEVWKGTPQTHELWFLCSGTWTCDITSAKVGERLLLLLHRWPDERLRRSPFRPELQALLHDQPFHSVEWAGRGRLPVELRKDAEGARVPMLDLVWLLPPSEPEDERSWRSLAYMKQLTRSILAENAFGTVLHPKTREPALAAILHQDLDEHGEVRTSVVAALFELSGYDEVIRSVAPSGSGPPYQRGFAKESFAPIRGIAALDGAQEYLDAPGPLPALRGSRELIVMRDPLFTLTRAGEPLADGAPKPEGPQAAERVLWNEIRRRILSVRPKDATDVAELQLEIAR